VKEMPKTVELFWSFLMLFVVTEMVGTEQNADLGESRDAKSAG